jgi:anaerobic magnesium-protoporphyrin IX monomethyl ester cyclase
MKILFLYPSLLSGFNSYVPRGNSESSYIDHGFAMLSAILKKEGHECFCMDLRSFQSWDHFEEILKQQTFDFTLTTFFSANEKFARQAIEIVKRNFPDKYIIGGGVHLSVTRTTSYPNIDSIVWGEGEPHVLNIANIIEKGGIPEKIYDLKMIEKMDDLPYVDRSLFNRNIEESSPLLPGLPEPFITIVAGRGCWGKCTFCYPSRNLINGNKCRIRSVDHFLGEIIELNNEKPIGSLMIHDDLLGNKKWIEEFIKKWDENLPRISFWCQLRADTILRMKEYIPDLSRIGMSYVSIGIESCSEKELLFLKKGITADQNYEACRLLQDNSINIFANVILGLPLQTKEDLNDTEKFMREIRPAYQAISIYTSYPGSELYKWIEENDYWIGNIEDKNNHYSLHRFPFERKIKGIDYNYIFSIIKKWNEEYKGKLRSYVKKTKLYNMSISKQPVVSVIIVTYNRPELLQQAMQSIFNQTLPSWELIINDYTENWQVNKEVYNLYSSDTRVRWIRHTRNINNISYCWNEALDLIEGEYWCTLDDDNLKYPDFLEKMVKYLDQHPDKQAVVCPMEHTGKMRGIFYRKPLSFQHLKQQNHVDSGQILYRKSVLEKIGMFDENMIMLEDWDFITRLYALNNETGSAIGWLDNEGKPLCSYSWHDKKRMFSKEIKPLEDKYYNIVRNKKIINNIKVKCIMAPRNLTASQVQLSNNIIEALKSLYCVTMTTEHDPDVLFVLGTLYNFTEQEIQSIRNENSRSKMVALLCEEPQATVWNMKYYNFFDRVVTNDINSYNYYDSKKFLYWNNLSISESLKKFVKSYSPKKEYDYCLIGYAYSSRVKFMKELQELLPSKKSLIIGDGWEKVGISGKICKTMNEIETAKMAMKSRIIIIKHRDKDDGGFSLLQPGSINRGYIEAAYKAALIIDNKERNFHCFDEGTYFSYHDAGECASKVNYILNNYNKCQDDIMLLHKIAIKHYTHKKRLLGILNCIVRSERYNKLII